MRLFPRRSMLGIAAATTAVLAMTVASSAHAEIRRLEIVAPASPGGGWDQTARAMQAALQEERLASGIQVQNIPGAGGTIGLAQFVSSKQGHGNSLMVSGLIMVGAILTNKAPVTLDEVTPIARLTGEYEVLAVTADSSIRSLDDLVAKLKSDPGSVSWGGGSAGGTDQILVGLIGKAVGADPAKLNYIAHSGGGEAMSSILGGHVTVGVNGAAELMPQITAGKLRPLAISSETRVEGFDIPTLKEQGIDVALTNWRGVMAPAGIKENDKKELSEMVAAMVASPAWKATLEKQGWIDLYQPSDEFAAFLKENQAQVTTTLKDIGLVQ
jgi:putative tricarboxylic transport membrane protein